jgi:DNA polymerase-3 subunit alpha
MPILDTCTEVTFLVKLPGGRGGKFKLPTLTELHSYLFNKPSVKRTMRLPMSSNYALFLGVNTSRFFTKEELDVRWTYFKILK